MAIPGLQAWNQVIIPVVGVLLLTIACSCILGVDGVHCAEPTPQRLRHEPLQNPARLEVAKKSVVVDDDEEADSKLRRGAEGIIRDTSIKQPSSHIVMRVTDEHRSPSLAVVLAPRESRVVHASCDEELYFVLFQAHTRYGADVTLAYTGDWQGPPPANASCRSRNAGLVRSCQPNAEVLLINEKLDRNLTVLLVAVGYSRVDPIPGGCAIEFALRVSPFLRLRLDSPTEISLEFQNARAGSLHEDRTMLASLASPSASASSSSSTSSSSSSSSPSSVSPLSLSSSSSTTLSSRTSRSRSRSSSSASSSTTSLTSCSASFASLSYDIYLYYLSPGEDYHAALRLMSDARQMPRHATRVHASDVPRTRAIFVAYPQTRAIYGVLVRQRYRGSGYETAAAYAPVATLGCADYPALAACRTSTGSVVALALVTALSLCMTLAGHRFLKTQIGAAAFLLGLLTLEPVLQPAAAVAGSALGALAFSGVWFVFGVPTLAVLPSGFLLGLLAAAVFSFTPVGGNMLLLRSAFAFRTMTVCSMLAVTALLLPTAQLLSIVASAVVGSFCSLYAIDRVFLHSTFSKIVDVARARFEATTSIHTHYQVPFGAVDVLLILIWIALSVTGVIVQYRDTLDSHREFPVAPIKLLKRRLRKKRGRLICTCVSRFDEDASYLMQENVEEFPPPGYSTFHGRNILI